MAIATPKNFGLVATQGSGANVAGESELMKKADRYLLITIIIGGTWVFGVFALPFAYLTYVYLNKAQAAGQLTRPWSVTILGAFVMIDASINALGWGMDFLWSNQSVAVQTLWTGYGKLVDGAYYIDYNSTALGGTAFPGEKAIEVWGVLFNYSLRIAACWGFLKMKRWGLQGMIISSWLYIAFWIAYVANMYMDFDARMGVAEWGNAGLWFILIAYAGPFLIMPYLYTVNRELFTD